jgi:hypothetical protein
MMGRLPVLVAASFVVTSCAFFRGDELAPAMDRLVGHSVAEVVVILGPPTNRVDAGGGKLMFQFDRNATHQTAGIDGRTFAMASGVAPQTRQPECLVAVIAKPARARSRSSAPADWIVETWSANGDCR